MSEKIKGLTVAFDKPLHEDYVKQVIDAILLIKGVADVSKIEETFDDYIVESRLRRELGSQLMDIVYPQLKNSK